MSERLVEYLVVAGAGEGEPRRKTLPGERERGLVEERESTTLSVGGLTFFLSQWLVSTSPGQSELACVLEVEGCVHQRLPCKNWPGYSLPAGIERVNKSLVCFLFSFIYLSCACLPSPTLASLRACTYICRVRYT